MKTGLAALIALAFVVPVAQSAEKPYPLDICLVSGEGLKEMGEPYLFVFEGREIKLCCKPCIKDFKKEPAKYIALVEAAEKKPPQEAKKAKPYRLKTCLVSDEPLGSMGDPYVFIHEDREIKLCCKGCLSTFKKETAKLITKLEKAGKQPKN